jgi:acetyltransferase-like isoleucine patch superfamily enzyme
MTDRFADWQPPPIEEGKPNKYHWLVQNKDGLRLGHRTDIGAFTYINAKHGVTIGDEVQIGSHCSIYTVSTIDGKEGPVVLERNCRIGSHSVVLPGVTVGENAVVGAMSLVNRDIPRDCVAYGVPARPARSRGEALEGAAAQPEAPRLLALEDLAEGDSREETITLTRAALERFGELSGDRAPVHVDPEHARRLGFERPIAHALLVEAGYSRLLGMVLPGGNAVIHELSASMKAPVYPGDRLTYRVRVARLVPAARSVELALSSTNQAGVVVNDGMAVCVFRG